MRKGILRVIRKMKLLAVALVITVIELMKRIEREVWGVKVEGVYEKVRER